MARCSRSGAHRTLSLRGAEGRKDGEMMRKQNGPFLFVREAVCFAAFHQVSQYIQECNFRVMRCSGFCVLCVCCPLPCLPSSLLCALPLVVKIGFVCLRSRQRRLLLSQLKCFRFAASSSTLAPAIQMADRLVEFCTLFNVEKGPFLRTGTAFVRSRFIDFSLRLLRVSPRRSQRCGSARHRFPEVGYAPQGRNGWARAADRGAQEERHSRRCALFGVPLCFVCLFPLKAEDSSVHGASALVLQAWNCLCSRRASVC
jgi:hypothetical protein